MESKLEIFEEKEIRKVYKNNKWYFSISDIIYALTDTEDTKDYIKKMKKRDDSLKKEWNDIITSIYIDTKGGRQSINFANTEGILRIIQSIPSPKAEPFKLWLAKVGSERIEEINNPELLADRMKKTYEMKGYSKNWIEQRERGIETRHILTDEWNNRGARKVSDYAILTNEIYKAGFGLSAKQYKEYKGLHESKNLRDSMSNIELALTNLGEATAVEFHKSNDSNGMSELTTDMNKAGNVLNKAKIEIEKEIKKSIVTSDNYKELTNDNKIK